MTKIIVFNCVVCLDNSAQNILIASSNKDRIVLPSFEIENPKFLYNEIRYNIKNLFPSNAIRFLEEIQISFIDIQNYLLLNFLNNESSKQDYGTIEDSDIILFCGVILHEKVKSDHIKWISINQSLQHIATINNDLNNVIKYIFDKLII